MSLQTFLFHILKVNNLLLLLLHLLLYRLCLPFLLQHPQKIVLPKNLQNLKYNPYNHLILSQHLLILFFNLPQIWFSLSFK